MHTMMLARKLRRALTGPACFAAFASASAFAQTANPPAQPAPVTPPNEEEVITLSPFEVTSATQKGYYGANTLSGTRFNTKLSDLGSSITVMTKQQMTDFGMLDMNDMFLYVAGTEGTGTYTDYSIDRNGSIADNVQSNPTQANRVRGIGSANVSFDNIETMNRVPIDSLEVEAVEISRGPNANVFGLGNPSGTVNIVPISASLTKTHTLSNVRGDSWGGWRTDFDHNQVLLKDRLAIRVSGIFQHDGFERKPSGVDTERFKVMVKAKPFKNTTITASISGYHAYGNRPNEIPPRDNISYWISKGKPYWDPVTMTIHNADGTYYNGTQTASTFTAATYNGPDVFTSSYLGNNHNQMYIDQGGLVYWSAPQIVINPTAVKGATAAGPTGTSSTMGSSATAAYVFGQHYLQLSAAAGSVFSGTAPRPFDQPLFNTTPTISDRSVYDYGSINASAPNRFWDRTTTYYIKVDQIVLDTPVHFLAAQAAFLREDSDRWARNLLGTINDNGQSGQLMVDINKYRLDGSLNPFFGRPYIASDKPRTQENPQKWDTSRVQAIYKLDLSKQDNLLKYFGWLQLTGYGEYKYRLNRQYSWRDAMYSPVSWIPTGSYTGFQSAPSGTPANITVTQGEYRYYVGDAGSTQVQYAPSTFTLGNYPFVWVSGSGSTSKTDPTKYTYTSHTDSITLGQVAADKTGGSFNSKTTLKTAGLVAQSHLLDDRLITTFGWRNDTTYTKYGFPGNPTNAYLNADGTTFNYSITNGWAANYYKNGGHTTNVQFVLKPFFNTALVKRMSDNGNKFFAELLNGLSFYTNKSNNFLPTLPAQDLYRNLLPNTTGNEKSWGVGLSLFNDSVQMRLTRYQDLQRNAQTTDISTMAQRILRIDFNPTGSGTPTPWLNLYDNATHWVQWQHPTWTTDQIASEVATETGFSAADNAYYTNAVPPVGATTDVRSTGTELELNLNLTNYWTVALAASKMDQSNTNISSAMVKWRDSRLPIWTSLVDPSIKDADATAENNPGKLWWKHRYAAAPVAGANASYSATAQTPEANYNAFVYAPLAIMLAQEGKSSSQIRPYSFRVSSSVQLRGLFDNKHLKRMTVGGALRWEDRAVIGYYGVQSLPAQITDLDPNRPIYDKSQLYVDAFVAYAFKTFDNKIGTTLRFNVQNLGKSTRLQPIGAFPDGTISTYRIMDPQKLILTLSFDI